MVRGVEVGGAGKGGGDFTFNNSKIKTCNPYNLNNSTLADFFRRQISVFLGYVVCGDRCGYF